MSNCRKWMNDKAAELNDDNSQYFEEMKEAWFYHIEKLAGEYFDSMVQDIDDKPDVTAFSYWLEEEAGEFEFPDYPTWFESEVSSVCDDYSDYLYEMRRDSDV